MTSSRASATRCRPCSRAHTSCSAWSGEATPVQRVRWGATELASRLAFFLWSQPPDAELVRAAAAGELDDDGKLAEQVERMLRDPRAEALSTRFAAQWFRLQDLEKLHPDALAYPQYDQTLARSMRRETELLFQNIVDEDASVLELLTADYTFVDERLAKHYGIANIIGPEFRRVAVTDPNRHGVLGHGSMLASTSHANRTSPVLRGKWVMEVLFGTPPPPPPPNVPELDEPDAPSCRHPQALGATSRLEAASRPTRRAMSCHQRHRSARPGAGELRRHRRVWRIKDRGEWTSIPTGELYDGTHARLAPIGLRDALLKYSDAVVFLRTFTANLHVVWTLGRRSRVHMTCLTVRDHRAYGEGIGDYRMSAFIDGIVEQPRHSRTTGRRRRLEEAPAGSGAKP